jgi:hypothetical protein
MGASGIDDPRVRGRADVSTTISAWRRAKLRRDDPGERRKSRIWIEEARR